MLVFSGNRQERLAFTLFPAVLKALSDGTEVAGMHKYFLARVANRGNCVQ